MNLIVVNFVKTLCRSALMVIKFESLKIVSILWNQNQNTYGCKDRRKLEEAASGRV
jgi:hypothetical protein